MWAYRLKGPSQLELVETCSPVVQDIGDGQVLLRVLSGGICGSDLPFFKGYGSAPAEEPAPYASTPAGFPLHEVVGEVVESRSANLPPGTDVVGWAEGSHGLAEFIVAEGNDLVPVQDALPPVKAVMAQPLACVIGAVDRLRSVRGRTAAVLGLGPIGLLFGHVLQSRGASYVTGVDMVDRSDVAANFGIDIPVRATTERWVEGLSPSARPELVIEAIGHQDATFADAVTAAGFQGELYYFGIPSKHAYPFDMTAFLRKQLTLSAGTTVERRRYLLEALVYLNEYPQLADQYVTHVVPINKVQRAYEMACRPAPGQLKITLDMQAGGK